MSSPAGGDLPDWNRHVGTADDYTVGTYTFAPGGSSGALDVSQYASLVIEAAMPAATHQYIDAQWYDAASNLITHDYMTTFDGFIMPPLAVPVRSQFLVVVASGNGVASVTLTIYGTTRALMGAIGAGYPSPVNAAVLSNAWPANTVQNIVTGIPQGLCQVELSISTTGVTVEYLMNYQNSSGLPAFQRFADTTDAHVVGPNTVWRGQVIFPHVVTTLCFEPRSAATFGVTCNIVALGH